MFDIEMSMLAEFLYFIFKIKKILNLVQALKDNKTPLQLVQMPCVTVELTKLKHDRLHSIHYHQLNQQGSQQQQQTQQPTPALQRQSSTQSATGGRERLDSDVHFKQSFSSRSPLFSCW